MLVLSHLHHVVNVDMIKNLLEKEDVMVGLRQPRYWKRFGREKELDIGIALRILFQKIF